LTREQVKLLGRFTRKIVVNFDPDPAGLSAATRSVDLFLEHGFRVNVLQLPEGEDPDSYILRHGVDKYLHHLKESVPFLDFLLSRFMASQKDPYSPSAKQEIASQILPYLGLVSHRVERAEYLSRVASRLRIDEDLLIREMRHRVRSREDDSVRLQNLVAEPTLAEKTLLVAALQEDMDRSFLSLLDAELTEGLATEKLFSQISEMRKRNEEISVLHLRAKLESSDQDILDRLVLGHLGLSLDTETISTSIDALREIQWRRSSRKLQEEIAEEERVGGDPSKLGELLRKKELLRRKWLG
jgi:DNA primase